MTVKKLYWIIVLQNYIHRQIEMNCLNRIMKLKTHTLFSATMDFPNLRISEIQ